MLATRNFTATIRLAARPRAVKLDGTAISDWGWIETDSSATIKIPGCASEPRVVTVEQ